MSLAEITHDLTVKALQASRLPDSHLAKVHAEINDLIDKWELAAIEASMDAEP